MHEMNTCAVIGAAVTKVPGGARHLPMDLDGVPVDVWYIIDSEDPDIAWVLVNGLDVHRLLSPEHMRIVDDAIRADEA